MPELPEVETVRRSLERRLPERRITGVDVRSPALREPLDRASLEALEGLCFADLRRRAKYLLLHLEDERTLVIHLGMSGRLTVVPGAAPTETHEHLALHLDDGARLRLVDPRRFGQAFVLPRDAIPGDRHFAHLGVEPLGDDFAGERGGRVLARAAEGRRGPIKTFLMDARIVVGVGNIYACEALWTARVNPKRSVARVAESTWSRVAEAVREILTGAVRQGGTTLNDFQDGEGNAGYFQVSLAVYGREGEPCRRCRRPIRRIVQSGRSTFYCTGCQH